MAPCARLRMLERHFAARAASVPPEKLVSSTLDKTPMMAMTISNSMRVKAGEEEEEEEEIIEWSNNRMVE